MEVAYIPTPLGTAKLEGDENGLQRIVVLNKMEVTSTLVPEVLEDASYQLQEYFEGARSCFTLTLNPVGTVFQKKVWEALQGIPYGTTVSYFELSKKLGNIKAIRAVAAANAKNPLWIVVPCHRIIGSNGDLTGYAGGLHRKQWLLEHESPAKQQRLF